MAFYDWCMNPGNYNLMNTVQTPVCVDWENGTGCVYVIYTK